MRQLLTFGEGVAGNSHSGALLGFERLATVPVPGSLALLGVELLAGGILRRRPAV